MRSSLRLAVFPCTKHRNRCVNSYSDSWHASQNSSRPTIENSRLIYLIIGGRWLLNISIPPDYPHSPPTIRFSPSTPICHANIAFRDSETLRSGDICLDLLKDAWSPAYTISSTLTSIHQLLTSAEPDSPLNLDVAQLLRSGDETGAGSLIRYYTSKYRYDERR